MLVKVCKSNIKARERFSTPCVKELLMSFKDKENRPIGREHIACAIAVLSQTQSGKVLFTADNQVKELLVSMRSEYNSGNYIKKIEQVIQYLIRVKSGI